MTEGGSPRAGWYQDPLVAGQMRWWDGQNWTDHTHVLGSVVEVTQRISEALEDTTQSRTEVSAAPRDEILGLVRRLGSPTYLVLRSRPGRLLFVGGVFPSPS